MSIEPPEHERTGGEPAPGHAPSAGGDGQPPRRSINIEGLPIDLAAMLSRQDIPEPKVDPQSLLISETFVSVQGEGLFTGVPSWFVRLSGCNLRCRWCDTPYASWKSEGARRSLDELVAEAVRAKVPHAVITGGEPMMFPQVTRLSRLLTEAGLVVTIETAGTVHQPVMCGLMSISPKLAGSTPSVEQAKAGGQSEAWGGATGRHAQRRLNVPVLQQLLREHPAPKRQLKFVVSSEDDLREIDSILAQLQGWTNTDVLLMPEGVGESDSASAEDRRRERERKQMVAQACIDRGWRYCARVHIDIFGNKRGT